MNTISRTDQSPADALMGQIVDEFIEGQSLAEAIADLRLQIADLARPARVARPESSKGVEATEAAITVPQSAIRNPKSAISDTPPQARLSTEPSIRSPGYFRTIARLGMQAAMALEHAHELGIVHRDIKPGNLMLDARGNLWVTDFGLAQIQRDNKLTLTGDLIGTLRYMSPEQALAKRVQVDHRTDIYSLGATLYELLTLEPVFTGGDRQELLRQIAFEEPRAVRRQNKAIPAELETIVLKALEKNPDDRYSTARNLADDLHRFVNGEPIRARRASLKRQLKAWCGRHKPLVTALTAILITLCLLGAGAFWVEERKNVATAAAVTQELNEAQLLQKQEQWAKALQILERARGQLKDSNLQFLKDQVEQRRQEAAWVAQLQAAQLKASDISSFELEPAHLVPWDVASEQNRDYSAVDKAYATVFANNGLDIVALSPDEIIQRIRNSVIKGHLVAALDYWSVIKDRLPRGNGEQFRTIAREVDDNSWRQKLRNAQGAGDLKALELLVEEHGILDQPAINVLTLSYALDKFKAREAKVRLLRRAATRHFADFWINLELAMELRKDPATLADAVGFYRVAAALQPQRSTVHNNLGAALFYLKKWPEAEAAVRTAIELEPTALYYCNLGNALFRQKFPAALPARGHGQASQAFEAAAAYRKAIELKPDFAEVHLNLADSLNWQGPEAEAAFRKAKELNYARAYYNAGNGYVEQGNAVKAEESFRKAIELNSNSGEAYNNLGTLLANGNRPDEAVDVYRKGIKHNPTRFSLYYNLGLDLAKLNELPATEAALRKAVELKPESGKPYNNLAVVLREQKKLSEAIALWHKAIEIEPKDILPYVNLAFALRDLGRFEEAIPFFKRARDLDPKNSEYAGWVRACEKLASWDPKLRKVLSGETPPADPAERVALAELCAEPFWQLYATSVRLFTEAFAADPKLEDVHPNRYNAACAAASAGCSRGKDAHSLNAEKRIRLRAQARSWLRTDLTVLGKILDSEPATESSRVQEWMKHWQADKDFDAVREESALAKLPEAERQEWQQLWYDVEELRQRASAR